jgi:hypothetical protein
VQLVLSLINLSLIAVTVVDSRDTERSTKGWHLIGEAAVVAGGVVRPLELIATPVMGCLRLKLDSVTFTCRWRLFSSPYHVPGLLTGILN